MNPNTEFTEPIGRDTTAVLPLSPLPPISYLRVAARSGGVCFDGRENFVKQSIRNRYHILSANGVHTLTIPVVHTGGKKIATEEIRIDYGSPWVAIHLKTLTSAYASAPFFEYYMPRVERLFRAEHETLAELFAEGWKLWVELLGLEIRTEYSDAYVEKWDGVDMRHRIKRPEDFPREWSSPPYPQVFEDRYGFVPNLCILDLLFNEGPQSKRWL